MHRRKSTAIATCGLLLLLAVVTAPAPAHSRPSDPLPALAPGSIEIDCGQANTRVAIAQDSHLDPSCTWTEGFDIGTSDVVLDCRGATVAGGPGVGGVGIEIRAPEDVVLHDVTVRNCIVDGFLNNLKVTRDGFRTLAEGEEFDHATERITIEDSTFRNSHGVGVYVDGYVVDTTIERNLITGTGSSGIYLETGSKQSTVRDNDIVGNGYIENGPGGKAFTIGGQTLWFWGVGREGISVDGSFENTIVANRFSDNANGGVLLYKNCGEYPDRAPHRYFERRYPSDDNLIADNTFTNERNGIWVASRMAENTLPMECTDPAYVDEPARRVVLDYAADNQLLRNRFRDVTYGIRVEDDGTTIADNVFEADSPDHHAIVVGTPDRTAVLGRPVADTTVTGNRSTITANPNPYRWIHGSERTTVEGNTALGHEVGLCEGQPLPRSQFIFVIAFAPEGPNGERPPTPSDLTVASLGALEPCSADPTTTTTTTTTSTPQGSTEQPPAAVPVSGRANYAG